MKKDTTLTQVSLHSNKAGDRIVRYIRGEIETGRVKGGHFLPTERELAEKFGFARMTIRRALRRLEAEGLLGAVPRHGYKVALGAVNGAGKGCPLAYVLDETEDSFSGDDFHRTLSLALQREAGRHGSSLLTTYCRRQLPAWTIEQLRLGHVWGVAIDGIDIELIKLTKQNGLPAILVDAWVGDASIDAVIQDDFHGGMLAAKHLIDRGHRKIGWLGPDVGDSSHSMGRYGGACAKLAAAGLSLQQKHVVCGAKEAYPKLARRLLDSPDRPSAVLALWGTACQVLVSVGAELNLVAGRDFDVVGWTPEELYSSSFAAGFSAGQVPPAIVWSVATMTELAVARLIERRNTPSLIATKIHVPVKLQFAP